MLRSRPALTTVEQSLFSKEGGAWRDGGVRSEIREILRRLQLGDRARRIARDLEVSRNTVAHYRGWAAQHGLLTGP